MLPRPYINTKVLKHINLILQILKLGLPLPNNKINDPYRYRTKFTIHFFEKNSCRQRQYYCNYFVQIFDYVSEFNLLCKHIVSTT